MKQSFLEFSAQIQKIEVSQGQFFFHYLLKICTFEGEKPCTVKALSSVSVKIQPYFYHRRLFKMVSFHFCAEVCVVNCACLRRKFVQRPYRSSGCYHQMQPRVGVAENWQKNSDKINEIIQHEMKRLDRQKQAGYLSSTTVAYSTPMILRCSMLQSRSNSRSNSPQLGQVQTPHYRCKPMTSPVEGCPIFLPILWLVLVGQKKGEMLQ